LKRNDRVNKKFGDKTKKSYDAIADTWNEKREWYIEQGAIDEAITHLPIDAKILDVGCGSVNQKVASSLCGFYPPPQTARKWPDVIGDINLSNKIILLSNSP